MEHQQLIMIRGLIFWGGLAFFLIWELLRPYRRPSLSKLGRWANNLGLTVFNTAALNLVFTGLVFGTAYHVTAHKIGLLNQFALPYWLKVLATVVFMDFMLWVWHLLNHEVPLLWRFHRVHHTDRNMDVSTATRFHIGELSVSALIKMGLIYLIGADILGLLIFETALVFCAQFHHSSLRVSPRLEGLLWPLFVPPSMHRIHHSVKIRERDANYGTIFSLWDRFLGTLVRKVDQDSIIIGVGGHNRDPRQHAGWLLLMPFFKAVR